MTRTPSKAVVVDDDPIILANVCHLISEIGFDVLDATCVVEALQHFEIDGEQVAVLFTDVHMPGGRDGFELAREVAARWTRTRIVVASGNASPRPGDLPEGALFIPKPFNTDAVTAALDGI